MNALNILCEATLKGSVLMSAAGLTLALWRSASAATRHLVWLLGVIGALTMPVLTVVVPDWQIVPERTLDWVSNQTRQSTRLPQSPGPRLENEAASQSSRTFQPQMTVGENDSLTPSDVLVLTWLGGMAVMLLFLFAGLARTLRVVRGGTDPDNAIIHSLIAKLFRERLFKRRVRVVLSESLAAPFVWGWRRAAIVLPSSAKNWSTHRLSMVFAHESAHVRRYDNVTGIVGRLTLAFYWFNPLVWLAVRRMRAEQERACDDYVLRQGISAPEYAEQLLDISQSVSVGNRLGLDVAFMRRSQLGERLMAVLKSNRQRGPLSIGRTALLSLLMAAAILPLAALADRQTIKLDEVTPAQREAVAATLSGFYDALNAGEDYEKTCDTYLASGYFDPPGLTVENLEEGVWTAAFQNTLAIFTRRGVHGSLMASDRIKSIRRSGDRFIATLELNLTGEAYQVESIKGLPDSVHLKTINDPATGKPLMTEVHLARALEHEVIFTNENGEWKISRYDGPIGIKRMDVNNTHGPIFLVWLENTGAEVTPYGQLISKVIPAEYRPFNNLGIEFKLES